MIYSIIPAMMGMGIYGYGYGYGDGYRNLYLYLYLGYPYPCTHWVYPDPCCSLPLSSLLLKARVTLRDCSDHIGKQIF